MARNVDTDAFIDLGLADAHGADKWTVSSVEDIPSELVELREMYRDALSMYRNFEISPDEFVDALADMVVVDSKNISWTIGAKSGAWFKRVGEAQWNLASAADFSSGPAQAPTAEMHAASAPATTFQALETPLTPNSPVGTYEALNQVPSVVLEPSEVDVDVADDAGNDASDNDPVDGPPQRSGYGSGL